MIDAIETEEGLIFAPHDNPCPEWCDRGENHPYDTDSPSETRLAREHTLPLSVTEVRGELASDWPGDGTIALQIWSDESADLDAGNVETTPARVALSVGDEMVKMTASEVWTLVAALNYAGQVLMGIERGL